MLHILKNLSYSLVIVIFVIHKAYAQSHLPDYKKALESGELKISEEDLKKGLENFQNLVKKISKEAESLIDSSPNSNLTVLKHIKGEEGEDFVKKKSYLPNLENFENNKALLKETESDIQETIDNTNKYIESIPLFTKCTESKVVEESLPDEIKKNPDPKLQFDFLYLDKKILKPEELNKDSFKNYFGEKALVFPINNEKEDLLRLTFNNLNIPCLPYRLRITDKAYLTYYGEDALKNFDNITSGELKLKFKN